MAVKYTVSFQDLKGLLDSADLRSVLESVEAKVILNAVNGQMIVEVDPDTLNRYFRSGTEATLSEVAAILFERPVSDSFSMGDTGPTFVFNKNPSDSVGVTESIALLITIVRDFTESLTVSEAAALSVNQEKTDSFAVSESQAYNLDKGLSDTALVGEQAALSTSLASTDSLSMSESLSRVTTFNRSFSDSFTLDDFTDVDAVAKQVNGNKTNIFSMTEDHAMSLSKGLSDSFAPTELLAISLDYTLSDSASVGESISINLVSGASSVLNTSPINGFTLNA